MAKEGSVAPKERINIRYKPAIGDAKEDVELPLKLLMLGDYTQREDDTPLEERKPINIDKDNFNDVMRAQNLSLDISVKDKVTDEAGKADAELGMSLKFGTMKDFKPEQVARQVPELARLLELRDALLALKGPVGNIPSFRKRIQSLLDTDEAGRKKLLDELIHTQQQA
ncbi:MAG: type VI secretion system contractile sheath small subunit [Gammaproteobacteria bacterium]|nr:type VI secretion system contractile sheath small subunit [Gammaproteobacteria bacterium]